MSVRHLFVTDPRNVVDLVPVMKTSLPRSSRPVRTAPAPRSVAVVASVALVVGAGLTGHRVGPGRRGHPGQVQRLAAEMDRLEARASELDEQYLQTGLGLSKAETELKKNRDAVADAQARMDQARSGRPTATS